MSHDTLLRGETPSASARIVSIDVFRGFSIVGMLLTGAPGGPGAVHPQFRHAVWEAGTFADFVAPTFMWIVGMSLYFYLKKRRQHNGSTNVLIGALARRCAVLFVLGVALVNIPLIFFQSSDVTYPIVVLGTLQRIAVGLLIAGTICILVPRPIAWISASVLIITLYLSVIILFPAPGFGPGDFSPDGNAAHFVDRLVLENHISNSHPLLSLLGAAISVLFGAATARLLDTPRDPAYVFSVFLALGVFLMLCGGTLSHWIPSVMYIWTPSYAVFMAGVSTAAYGVLYWIVEIWKIQRVFYPLVVLGLNPIAVLTAQWFVETTLGSKGLTQPDGQWQSLGSLLYQWFAQPFPNLFVATFVFNLVMIALWCSIFHLFPAHTWKARILSLQLPIMRRNNRF